MSKKYAIIILLELIFIISLSYTLINYQLDIIENSQEMIAIMNEANFNATSLENGEQFMDNAYLFYKNYQEMITNLTYLIIWLILIFYLVKGSSWILANYFNKKSDWKKLVKNFVLNTTIVFLPISLLTYYYLRSTFLLSEVLAGLYIFLLIIITILSYYLLQCSYAFLDKDWLKTIKISFKKVHYFFPIFLIIWILIGLSIGIIYWSTFYNGNFIIMLLALIPLIMVLTFGKYYWIKWLRKLS
jgi:hypothetical protein